MHVRVPPSIAVVVALGCLASCSGGGSVVGSATFACTGTSANAICLQNCNLGCTETGCLRTDIAQNEIIILQFSHDIDPASVSPSSIRFRTPSGDQPVGEFFVNGNQVEFVPTLQVSGGQTFFGFTAGETYTMTIPGGATEPAAVRSTSGKRFAKTLSCTLRSTLGIVDLNGVAPRATLVAPSPLQLESAPRDLDIVLEFNEMVDPTPFQAGGGPVTFQVRRTRFTADPTDGDARECDLASDPLQLPGTSRVDFDPARSISILTFRPASPMPANVCVEIVVTSGVADLSGRPAQPQQFSFKTEQVPLTDVPVVEEFDDATHFDDEASAATWGGGAAVFGKIGGDARHGSFDVALGIDQGIIAGKRTWLINTDNTIIPAANTVSGTAVAVTNGQFFFDRMVVPSDVRLRFTGSWPPIFTVAGRLDIQGEIDVAGQSVGTVAPSGPAGQPGGAAGIFGGAGGKGGDKNPGTGVLPLTPYQGVDGQAARVLGGHGYAANVAATAGKGSAMFPATGTTAALIFPPTFTIAYSVSAAAGGSGGGYVQAGEDGRVVTNNYPNGTGNPPPLLAAMGPTVAGGAALPIASFPPPTGSTKSSLHFLVGGSGGGGAGSHACCSLSSSRIYSIGGGGGGGGGAIALRAGDSLRLGPLSKVLANGGSTPSQVGLTTGAQPAPGGGGSGGSVVLQAGRVVDLLGAANSIDVRGGTGGTWNRFGNNVPVTTQPPTTNVTIKGGNGSPGFVRLETPGTPSTGLLISMAPAATPDNVATLTELDDLVSFRSKFYATDLVFGPEYSHYEIHATVDGVPMVFSDDPTISTLRAEVGAPIQARFQCATLASGTNAVLETRPWRTSVRSVGPQVGIQSDGLNGFRFSLVLDRSLAVEAQIQKVVIVYRN